MSVSVTKVGGWEKKPFGIFLYCGRRPPSHSTAKQLRTNLLRGRRSTAASSIFLYSIQAALQPGSLTKLPRPRRGHRHFCICPCRCNRPPRSYCRAPSARRHFCIQTDLHKEPYNKELFAVYVLTVGVLTEK